MKYTAKQIKKTFLDYFTQNGHTQITNKSIVPHDDPSLLFINAGMAPMKRVFSGEEQPVSKRMCNVQTCIRTNDIDSIGDRHHLCAFNMLGSWSIGDYFKEGAITFAFNLLTKNFGIPAEKLYVTVFSGDEEKNIPADEDSAGFWQKVGIDKNHIVKCGFDDNFWSMGDNPGPCGPCTEVFYDTGAQHGPSYEETGIFDTKKRYIEIWNAGVFMQYYKDENGNRTELPFKSVDTGSGLERLLITLNGLESVYDTEIYLPIIEFVKSHSTNPNERSLRIIAEHANSSTHILNAGVDPSNVKRGYILRRLMRRLMRHLRVVGCDEQYLAEIYSITIDNMNETELNPDWQLSKDEILAKVKLEQDKFSKMLEQGLKAFNQFTKFPNNIENGKINSKLVFKLFDTFGFPFEMTQELAEENGYTVDEQEFNQLLEKHKEISRGNVTPHEFKSGLADNSDNTIRLHTATHLLHCALRHFFGTDLGQKGSNITPERLRFDFNLDHKMTDEEIKQVEDYVNDLISKEIPVVREEMPYDEAVKQNALGLFKDRYDGTVSVYTIGEYSKEICRGPHVNNTKELHHFKIQKEESSSAGIRRIKAILD